MGAFNFPVRHLDRQGHPRQPAGQTETWLATMGHETLYMHLYVKEGNQLTTNRSPWMPYGFTKESTKLGWDELNFNILYHRNRREIGGQGKALLSQKAYKLLSGYTFVCLILRNVKTKRNTE